MDTVFGWKHDRPRAGRLTLPEGEKDDRLDHEELEHGVVGDEQLTRGKVEEEESVERQTDRYVVDNGHVQVAASHAAGGRHRNLRWFSRGSHGRCASQEAKNQFHWVSRRWH